MIRNPLWLSLFISLILIAVAVGTLGLQVDSMWHDEQLSLLYAGGLDDSSFNPLGAVNRIIERESGQAPFYYMLLSIWGNLVGWSVMMSRTFSLLVGVLAIAWAYRLGSDIHSPFAGFCSAVILGASAFLSSYLHEIRTYSLLVLEILIVLTLYWRLLKHKRSLMMSVFFALTVTATLYTHPFSIVVIVALGLYHLVLAPRQGTWWRLFILFCISGILFLPWAVPTLEVIANRAENNTRTLTIRSNVAVIRDMLHAFSNGVWVFLILLIPSIPLLLKSHGIRLLWFMGVVFAGIMLTANQLSDMINHIRYLMPLLPMVILLMGIGLASLKIDRRIIFAVLFAWSVVGFVSAPSFGNLFYTREEHVVFHITFPFEQIIEDIRTEAVTNDAIALEFPYHSWAIHGTLDYYMEGMPARYILTEQLGSGSDEPQALIDGFDNFLGDAGRVWFVLDNTTEAPQRLQAMEAIMADRYIVCEQVVDDENARIDKLAQIEELCTPPDNPMLQFGDSVALLDFVHRQTEDYDIFYSMWSTKVPTDTYSLSLQFIDETGETVHQIDNPLPLGDFAYRIDRIERGILSADSSVTINGIVYAWQTGERLRLADDADMVEMMTLSPD